MSAEMVVIAVVFFLLSIAKEMLSAFLNKLSELYSEKIANKLFKKTTETQAEVPCMLFWEKIQEAYGKDTSVEITFYKNQRVRSIKVSINKR